MKKIFHIALSLMVAVSGGMTLASCGGKKTDTDAAKKEYSRQLGDSISIVETEIDSCTNTIKTLNDAVNSLLPQFETVTRPREAGSYMMLRPFVKNYPLRNTSVIARINDSEQFELIAALRNGTFDRIEAIGPDGKSLSSMTVPRDQALNFTNSDGLTTVLFCGPEADAIGKFIADNMLNDIKINYYGNSLVLSWRMPLEARRMIGATYTLYSSQREINRLSAREKMLHEKINLLRAHRDGK